MEESEIYKKLEREIDQELLGLLEAEAKLASITVPDWKSFEPNVSWWHSQTGNALVVRENNYNEEDWAVEIWQGEYCIEALRRLFPTQAEALSFAKKFMEIE
jgi:hypothetical protein